MSCLTPFYVDNPRFPYSSTERQIPAPCGKCIACLKRRAGAWGFRLMQQEKIADSAHFVTLTYDNDKVNTTPNGFLTVSKRDVQLFMKRLRKESKTKIKYYLAAEYGTKTKRPHYHMIIFNCDTSIIAKAWSLGAVDIGTVTDASVNYSLKYITKGKSVPAHGRDDRTPEFQLMSKGLGQNYLTENIKQYHKDDLSRSYVTSPDGHKIAMPRYYRDKLYTDQDKITISKVQKKLIEEKQAKLNQKLNQRGEDPLRFDFENRKHRLTKKQDNDNEKI